MNIKVKDLFSIIDIERDDSHLSDYVIFDRENREVDRTGSIENLLSEYGENNILEMNIEPFGYDNEYDIILCLDFLRVKEDDILFFDSENGLTYKVEVVNINDFREPSMKYAIDLIDCNGTRYSDVYGDITFVGQDFIDKCRKEL